jgi:signal transduction histidine kinase
MLCAAVQLTAEAGMKRRREGNTRFRLILTLGLAVVLPAIALVYVNFRHVKAIQRDKKVEALILRDFDYILAISEKQLNEKAYKLAQQAKDDFPDANASAEEQAKQLDAMLIKNPWFLHAYIFDSQKELILRSQPGRCNDPLIRGDVERLKRTYNTWFGSEGKMIVEELHKRPKPISWYGGQYKGPDGEFHYSTTSFFTFPYLSNDRVVLGGVVFDPRFLKESFFPEMLNDLIAKQEKMDQKGMFPGMLHELKPSEAGEHKDQRLAMMLYPGDATSSSLDHPLAMSPGWSGGEPEVSRNLEEVFRGLKLGIKFQGTTAKALGEKWVLQSLLILGVLSVLMIGGLVLTYRSVNKQMALARLKSDFVSNVSHELRTPLALIRLYAETLELGRITTDEKKHDYYGIIRKESERLTALINNILDFSRIEAGAKEYDFRETDIAELVRNTLDSYRFQIEQQGFALEEQIDPGIPRVRVDREAIARALVNLVNNALKYSDNEKFLGVRLYRDNAVLKLEVSDRGIGIERHEQTRIFEKFYRTCDPLVHNTKGSGLGLSLVKHITHAHGGEVQVESTPGRGSKFTLSLPLAETGTIGSA